MEYHRQIKGNLTNENNIKLLRINNHIVCNPINIANEFNDYFLNIAGGISYKRTNEKKRCKSITTFILNASISHLKIKVGLRMPVDMMRFQQKS